MLRYGFEIFQELIKMFVRTNKRFPNPQENKFIQNQALRIRESLLDKNVNLENLTADEAIKLFSKPPVRTTRPKQQPAGIETLPLKDKQLRMQAIQKTLDARNQQALEKLRSKMKSGEIKKGAAPKTNLTKVRKRIMMDRQNLLDLAKNEQIPVKNVEDFLSGKTDKVLRPSGRGIIQRDKEGNPFITETYSSKYDPLRKNKLFDDEPEFKDGGLATLFMER